MIHAQKQLFRHDPENGVYGDCHRTAYACLLGLPASEVPHFADRGDAEFTRREKEWLAENGFDIIAIPYPGGTKLDDILSSLETVNPGIPYILGGTSKNGCGHSVVCHCGRIVCDPSLDDSGIIGPMSDGYWWVTYLVQLPAQATPTAKKDAPR